MSKVNGSGADPKQLTKLFNHLENKSSGHIDRAKADPKDISLPQLKEQIKLYKNASITDIARDLEANFNDIDRDGNNKISFQEASDFYGGEGVSGEGEGDVAGNGGSGNNHNEENTVGGGATQQAHGNKPTGGASRGSANVVSGQNYAPIPGGGGAEMNYVDVPKKVSKGGPITVNTNGADYILIHSSSGGHGPDHANGVSVNHFNIPAEFQNRVVGFVGAKDASMILIDVRGLDKFQFTGQNETAYSLIKGVPDDMQIVVDNKAKNGENKGYIDPTNPGVGRQEIEMGPNSDAMIYKEDEGSPKNQNRIDLLDRSSGNYYNRGEDNGMFVTDERINMTGNGAYMWISFKPK
jgi:hypothetical protein